MYVPDNLTDQFNQWQQIEQTPYDQLNVDDYVRIYRIKGKRIFQGIVSIQDKVTKITDSYIYAYSGKYYRKYNRPVKIVRETKGEEE